MTVREAESDAHALLRSSWWDSEAHESPLPVDPFALAKGLGIQIERTWLPPDESGNIVIPANGTVVITINMYDHENRQRFTCAHELGHYTRRRKKLVRLQTKTFVDYRNTLASAGRDVEEIYANQFAAALLMPPHLIEDAVRTTVTDVDALAAQFGTSPQAIELRLRNLGLQGY